MSAIAACKPYDQVFDAQKHYRTLLQCTARPGSIAQLDDVLLDVAPPLNRAAALIALTLLSADSTFYLSQREGLAEDFLRRETLAKPAAAEQADFLFITDPSHIEDLELARAGSLAYPEQGATAVVQIAAISPAPMTNSLRLTFKGPGIETETSVFVLGASEALFQMLRRRNAEFPLGVDAYLTCDSLSAGPCVLALPRSTQVRWERA
jgi:alpha-D-ribose 1-methylphosphonate 5-triphosphate synthase subunit PhnH